MATILPSIYLAYRIAEQSIFETNAKAFVQKEFDFKRTQVVTKSFKMEDGKKHIELLLIGQTLSKDAIDSLKKRMQLYQLGNTQLIIRQGLDAKQEIDLAQVKASILEDVFNEEKQDTVPPPVNKPELTFPDIRTEMKVLYPIIKQYSLTHTIVYNTGSTNRDTLTLFSGKTIKPMPAGEKKKLAAWLKERIKTDSVKIILE